MDRSSFDTTYPDADPIQRDIFNKLDGIEENTSKNTDLIKLNSESIKVNAESIRTNTLSLYGKIELGELKGGIVSFIRDIKTDINGIRKDVEIIKTSNNGGLSGKEKATIYVSLITSMSAVVVTIISCLG